MNKEEIKKAIEAIELNLAIINAELDKTE